MEYIFKSLAYALTYPLDYPVRELAAIWLTKPVLTNEGKSVRITAGMKVLIEEGELVDLVDIPTHEILECRGRSSSDFSLTVKNLITGETSIVIL